jgi:hypothetical protein
MPFNITQGSCVEFTVTFFDAASNVTVPTSGTLSVIYTNVAGSTASSSIALVGSGSFFIGYWGVSSNAALGFANWSVTAPGLANNPAANGQLRIISP